MKDIIKDLYYGDFPSFAEINFSKAESAEIAERISCIHEKIVKAFPESEELLESYRTALYESSVYYGCQQFELGMKAGAQLMKELLSPIK